MELVVMERKGSFIEYLLINSPVFVAFCTNLLAGDAYGDDLAAGSCQSVGNDCCYEGKSKRRCCSTVLTMILVSSQAPALRT
jgi:hypothetical protein